MLDICFIASGTELLNGQVHESNGLWLARQLTDRDARVVREVVLPDDLQVLSREIASQLDKVDIIVLSGGLGPTDDDITREALASALGRPLVFSEAAWLDIQQFFLGRGRTAGESNRKQALFVDGGRLLANRQGTAPGLHARHGRTDIYAFPGVPSELHPMVREFLLPGIPTGRPDVMLKLWGLGESSLMDRIRQHALIDPALSWGTVASKDGITLRFNKPRPDDPALAASLAKLRGHFAANIYAEGNTTPLQMLVQKLQVRGWKLACAESCTGGLLSSWITATPGSSAYFLGSVVSYANSVKQGLLQVSEQTLASHGAVSEACALEMAAGALHALGADLAISITGIAGPDGGSADKPVGTVHIGVCHKSGRSLARAHRLTGNRQDVRERSCHAACLLALELIGQAG